MSNAKETTVAITENYVEDILRLLTLYDEEHRNEWMQGIEKLTLNAVDNMSWYAKTIYVGQYMEHEYKKIATLFIQYESDVEGALLPALEEKIEEYDYFLSMPCNIRSKSTCEVTQMTSTWEYECQLNAKNQVNKVIKQLKKHIKQL